MRNCQVHMLVFTSQHLWHSMGALLFISQNVNKVLGCDV